MSFDDCIPSRVPSRYGIFLSPNKGLCAALQSPPHHDLKKYALHHIFFCVSRILYKKDYIVCGLLYTIKS